VERFGLILYLEKENTEVGVSIDRSEADPFNRSRITVREKLIPAE